MSDAVTPLSTFEADWPAISALLDEALNLPASEHTTWLDSLVGEHAAYRDSLRLLLKQRHGIETDDFLGQLPRLNIDLVESPSDGLGAGSQVGAYRLISEIGRGGMGTVWLAERSDGLMKRRVALKLPRVVWGDAFAERLGREREILATLEHQHIARLYDAGVDTQGRPFLAMEYVEGQSIDAYCREHSAGVRERIALLVQVMAAVSHAHARLVVHRDLKPGNILVTSDGQVKLLDFGIAKLLEGDRTRETALTELGGRALTLDYASPEQIRGEPLGTASDIYSMAVVAYEVLAGVRPYRLKRASAAELEEAIAAGDPPLASASASDRRAARQLRGDLDSILNKALKKVPGERYLTMDAFAQDLRRHVQGEPVEARPDGWRYRASKFVRRYRLQVAAGTVVTVALVAGTSVALWQAREAGLSEQRAKAEAARAQVEAATARAVQGFIESVFNANSSNQADPVAAQATTARALLDRGAERIDRELASAPEAQLRLYKLLAQMYDGMSLVERGLSLNRRALTLATRLYGANSDVALEAASQVGLALDSMGRRDEALKTLLQADAAARSRRHDDDHARMMIDIALSHLYYSADPPRALERARHAAAIARTLGVSTDGIDALYALGANARTSGNLTEARLALVDAAAWIDRQGATGMLPNVLAALGQVQDELGEIEAAGATLARAIAEAGRTGDPRDLHAARFELTLYQYKNRLLREALDSADGEVAWVRGLGPREDFGDLPVVVMVNYGLTLVAYGDAERALRILDEARALLPQDLPDRMVPLLAARADALVALGRLGEAGADVERALATVPRGADRSINAVHAARRRYWVATGRPEQALQDFRDHPQKPGETNTVQVRLRRQAEEAELLLAAGHEADARAVTTDALAALARLPERRFKRDAEARLTAVQGHALLHEDRVAEALPVLERALALHLAHFDPKHSPATAKVRLALAEAQRRAAH